MAPGLRSTGLQQGSFDFHAHSWHLVKKQMKIHALTNKNFRINKSAIGVIIEKYTREAGVRLLEKNIATVCRKAAVKIVDGAEKVTVGAKDIEEYLC